MQVFAVPSYVPPWYPLIRLPVNVVRSVVDLAAPGGMERAARRGEREQSALLRTMIGDGAATVGDSAAFIDPFTGSGILMALESSRILAGSIERQWQSGPFEVASDYQRMYDATFDNRLRWSSMLRHASFNTTVAEVIVAGLGLSAPLRKRIARLTRLSAENI